MIIEGAFFKLPELLIESPTPDQQYESTLVSHFAMAVLLEFGARSIQQPMNRVHIERPYPSPPGVKSSARADLPNFRSAKFSRIARSRIEKAKPVVVLDGDLGNFDIKLTSRNE